MTTSNITQYPTVHMNGTSKDALLDAYTAANSALLDALEALEACAPNGRDYYMSGDISKAITEHNIRTAAITTVRREINLLAEHVADS